MNVFYKTVSGLSIIIVSIQINLIKKKLIFNWIYIIKWKYFIQILTFE